MRSTYRSLVDVTIDGGILLIVAVALLAFAGCERKETIIDVKTPRSDIEVERDKDTGNVTVEVDR
jgi:hypothetical protein